MNPGAQTPEEIYAENSSAASALGAHRTSKTIVTKICMVCDAWRRNPAIPPKVFYLAIGAERGDVARESFNDGTEVRY